MTIDSLQISSVDGLGTLSFARREMLLDVRMTSPGLDATIAIDMREGEVFGRDSWADLGAFFRNLAKNWMDAPGPVQHSVGDDFDMRCDWNSAGHFFMHVRLCNTCSAKWSVEGKLELELGSLVELSRRMDALVIARA